MSARVLRDYHDRTKHSYESVRRSSGGLDWANQPAPFKEWVDLEPLSLPDPRPTGVRTHDVIGRSSSRRERREALTADALSHLLYSAAGVTRVFRGSFGEIHFRAYASAGALYPNEVYVVAGQVEGLDPGVYHYGPRDHDLRRLRNGDVRGALGLAGASPGTASIVVTGIPWRTAWKYGTRGFRHLYWDAGMVAANVLAAAAANGIPARLLLGFVDWSVAHVLGVDNETEFPLCVVSLGEDDDPPPTDVEDVSHRVAPISSRPRRDPEIEEAHAASVLHSQADVEAFREARRAAAETPKERDLHRIQPLACERLSSDPFETVVRRRGSSRGLARDAFPAAELGTLLDTALLDLPSDWNGGGVEAFVVASALEGLAPGAYRYVGGGAFDAIRIGDLRRKAGFVCLEQRLAADAAAAVFLATDLEAALQAFGGRGYAAAQLEAAIVAGRLYLGAYAQCLGASGITFYDDEVRTLFDTSSEPMLAVVMGPEGQRRSIIRCRERLLGNPGVRSTRPPR